MALDEACHGICLRGTTRRGVGKFVGEIACLILSSVALKISPEEFLIAFLVVESKAVALKMVVDDDYPLISSQYAMLPFLSDS